MDKYIKTGSMICKFMSGDSKTTHYEVYDRATNETHRIKYEYDSGSFFGVGRNATQPEIDAVMGFQYVEAHEFNEWLAANPDMKQYANA